MLLLVMFLLYFCVFHWMCDVCTLFCGVLCTHIVVMILMLIMVLIYNSAVFFLGGGGDQFQVKGWCKGWVRWVNRIYFNRMKNNTTVHRKKSEKGQRKYWMTMKSKKKFQFCQGIFFFSDYTGLLVMALQTHTSTKAHNHQNLLWFFVFTFFFSYLVRANKYLQMISRI